MGYISELRELVGTRPIILTGVTIIVLNKDNQILLQKRTDTGDWGVIGGALELAETFEDAAKRELYDEGLELEYFSLEESIDQLNPMTYKILKKSGYVHW